MDTLTHAALGASLGQLVLGRQLGARAMAWGAVAANLPDLDVVLAPFQDELTTLAVHRGFTHTLLAMAVAAALLGWVFARWYRTLPQAPGFPRWTLFFALCITSHLLLDTCTSYGTPLLAPFVDTRFALLAISVLDPFYTLPLCAAVVIGLCVRSPRARSIVCVIGLVVSSAYLGCSILRQRRAEHDFAAALAAQNVHPAQLVVAPLPLSTWLWYGVARDGDRIYYAWHSLWRGETAIRFQVLPQHEELLGPARDSLSCQRLIAFSRGLYTVRRQQERPVFEVLRFGMLPLSPSGDDPVFAFALEQNAAGQWTARNVSQRRWSAAGHLLGTLYRRTVDDK